MLVIVHTLFKKWGGSVWLVVHHNFTINLKSIVGQTYIKYKPFLANKSWLHRCYLKNNVIFATILYIYK